MKITIEKKDNAITVIIAGRLDTSTSVQAEKEFQTLYNTEAEEIIFDCSELEYVSSSGLRLFLSVLKLSRSEGSVYHDRFYIIIRIQINRYHIGAKKVRSSLPDAVRAVP